MEMEGPTKERFLALLDETLETRDSCMNVEDDLEMG